MQCSTSLSRPSNRCVWSWRIQSGTIINVTSFDLCLVVLLTPVSLFHTPIGGGGGLNYLSNWNRNSLFASAEDVVSSISDHNDPPNCTPLGAMIASRFNRCKYNLIIIYTKRVTLIVTLKWQTTNH